MNEDAFGVTAAREWTTAPFAFDINTEQFELTGAYINLPAMIITLVVTAVLIIGMKESAAFNSTVVVIKVIVVLLFIFAAIPSVKSENWRPFIPPNTGSFGEFGWSGVFQAATTVFFAYIGFDAVSTTGKRIEFCDLSA
jgi:APA family basic amino acid/polyamine antiporter